MSSHSRKASVRARSGAVKNSFSPSYMGALLLCLMLSSVALIAPASAATITVGSAYDWGSSGKAANCSAVATCTLRDAIVKASPATGAAIGDTIVFNLPANSMITLQGGELVVDKNLTIDGGNAPGLTISGNDYSRAVQIRSGANATLKQLALTRGISSAFIDGGGGILNIGALTLIRSTV